MGEACRPAASLRTRLWPRVGDRKAAAPSRTEKEASPVGRRPPQGGHAAPRTNHDYRRESHKEAACAAPRPSSLVASTITRGKGPPEGLGLCENLLRLGPFEAGGENLREGTIAAELSGKHNRRRTRHMLPTTIIDDSRDGSEGAVH